MKEFLNIASGEYKQAECMFSHSNWIEIPKCAEVAMHYKSGEIEFFKENYAYFWFGKFQEWKSTENAPKFYKSASVIWKRPTHPEPLPFIDDNPQSLNDQYAEIEQVRQELKGIDATLAQRQSEYGSFEDVAFVTENIMSILAKVRVNGLQDLPNTHRMALYMIASKMARIVNGDFNKLDSWHDIGGYAKLIENLIEGK